jgi:hypothetical protein
MALAAAITAAAACALAAFCEPGGACIPGCGNPPYPGGGAIAPAWCSGAPPPYDDSRAGGLFAPLPEWTPLPESCALPRPPLGCAGYRYPFMSTIPNAFASEGVRSCAFVGGGCSHDPNATEFVC